MLPLGALYFLIDMFNHVQPETLATYEKLIRPRMSKKTTASFFHGDCQKSPKQVFFLISKGSSKDSNKSEVVGMTAQDKIVKIQHINSGPEI